jgi:predicted nucleotidyltransferase
MLQSLFSSRVRVGVLTHLFSHPDQPVYARNLSREIGEHYNAVWQELNNLESIGLLLTQRNGNIKYYRLNPDFPIYDELKRIILKTSGLGQAIREAVRPLGTLEWAFIYGSVAAGEEDAFSDIDLMLIGELELMELAQVIAHLEDQLGREINYSVLTQSELAGRVAQGEPFVENVLAGPMVMLVGDENALRGRGAGFASRGRTGPGVRQSFRRGSPRADHKQPRMMAE